MDQLIRVSYWSGLLCALAAFVLRLAHYIVPMLNGMTHLFFYRAAVLLLLIAAATAANRSLGAAPGVASE